MTKVTLEELIVPAPPYRMARPIATLAMSDGETTTSLADKLAEAGVVAPPETVPTQEVIRTPEELAIERAKKAKETRDSAKEKQDSVLEGRGVDLSSAADGVIEIATAEPAPVAAHTAAPENTPLTPKAEGNVSEELPTDEEAVAAMSGPARDNYEKGSSQQKAAAIGIYKGIILERRKNDAKAAAENAPVAEETKKNEVPEVKFPLSSEMQKSLDNSLKSQAALRSQGKNSEADAWQEAIDKYTDYQTNGPRKDERQPTDAEPAPVAPIEKPTSGASVEMLGPDVPMEQELMRMRSEAMNLPAGSPEQVKALNELRDAKDVRARAVATPKMEQELTFLSNLKKEFTEAKTPELRSQIQKEIDGTELALHRLGYDGPLPKYLEAPAAPTEESEPTVVAKIAPEKSAEDEKIQLGSFIEGLDQRVVAGELSKEDLLGMAQAAEIQGRGREYIDAMLHKAETMKKPLALEGKAGRVEQLTAAIEKAGTLEDLYQAIRDADGSIINSHGVAYRAENVIANIELIRKSKVDVRGFATGALGIREKARALLLEENPDFDKAPAATPEPAPKEPEPGNPDRGQRISGATILEVRRQEEQLDAQKKAAAEALIPRPDRMNMGAYLAEGVRHVVERSGTKTWFETMSLRMEAMESRHFSLWNGMFQQRAQGKLDLANEKVKDFQDKLDDSGPLMKLWYGNRLRSWQKRAGGLGAKVEAWNSSRERWASKHTQFQQEVIKRYDRELAPYKELVRDFSSRLEVQMKVRETLMQKRDEAVQKLAEAEAAGKKGRWFMGPRARKCVNKIKDQIKEMDRRIGTTNKSADKFRGQLADSQSNVDKWELKQRVIAQHMELPEMKGLKRPDRGPEVPIREVGNVETTVGARPASSRSPESAPSVPEGDPSLREWRVANFVEAWNNQQPEVLIEDAEAFAKYVAAEQKRLNLSGALTAGQLLDFTEPYLKIASVVKVKPDKFKRDRKYFLDNA